MAFMYVVILLLCLAFFVATNTAASLWVLVLVVLFGVMCRVDSFVGSRRFALRYTLRRAHEGSHPLAFSIAFDGPRFFVPSRIELDVVFENHLFNTKLEETLVLRPTLTRGQVFTYEYPQFECGKVIASVTQARYYDAFGFTHVSKAQDYKASVLVYPRAIPLHLSFDRSPLASYSGVAFDNYKQGSDKSETLDLRPYHEGDDLREVHWKLSAKLDDMVMRVASRPTDYHIAMIPDLCRFCGSEHASVDVRTLNNAISLFTSLSFSMMHAGVYHSVVLCDGERLYLRGIDDQPSWEAMVDELLSFPLPDNAGRVVDLFSVHPYARNYTKMLYVSVRIDEELIRELSENSDVTAFVVGEVEQGSYATADHGEIIALTSEQLEGRVEDLVV